MMGSSQQPSQDSMILMLMQALLGLVSPSLNGVALRWVADAITVTFLVAKTTAEIEEDIDEITSDFEAFLYPYVPRRLDVQVIQGRPDSGWVPDGAREVFRAKP
jgi:hypothetical protein